MVGVNDVSLNFSPAFPCLPRLREQLAALGEPVSAQQTDEDREQLAALEDPVSGVSLLTC